MDWIPHIRRSFAILVAVLAGSVASARPNLLLITADDMNWDSVGVYGCPVPDTTPHLDQLAREGMYFKYAHVNVAVCAPSRSIIMTGLYAHQSGAMGFAGMDSETRTLSALLKANGYRVGIIDKVGHLKPRELFEWDYVKDAIDTGHGRAPSLFKKHTAEFLANAATEKKPFFLMANSRDPHRPFAGSYQEWQYLNEPKNSDEANFGQPPEKIAAIETPSHVFETGEAPVPGFLAETPDLRDEISDYFSSVRRCDDTVAAILEAVEEAGQTDNTLVLFLSDNGMAFPFAKFSCYAHGTRTPMIVRWPGVIEPGGADLHNLVSGIDITPTFLEAAGIRGSSCNGRQVIPGLAQRPVCKGVRPSLYCLLHLCLGRRSSDPRRAGKTVRLHLQSLGGRSLPGPSGVLQGPCNALHDRGRHGRSGHCPTGTIFHVPYQGGAL